jgi:MFS family permease
LFLCKRKTQEQTGRPLPMLTQKIQPTSDHQSRLTVTQWLVCVIAGIGFAFDTYELLVLGLIVRPALLHFFGAGASPALINHWVGLLFYVPAVAGGIFGLLGGYLTDRLGRRRVLTVSILLYAASACGAGLAKSALALLLLRCTTFIGVSVEFVAATAWLAELFPSHDRREAILGITQSFSSVGGLIVAGAYYVCVTFSSKLPAIYGGHDAWRYALMSGLIPAIPLILVRPFLPESPVWIREKLEGRLKRPRLSEIFTPRFRKTAIITTVMMACSYGASFGAIHHIARILPGLRGVRELSHEAQEQAISRYQALAEIGGLAGRITIAGLLVVMLRRRQLLRTFQVLGLVILPLVFFLPAFRDVGMSKLLVFAVGFVTVAQFNFWGNYLPLVYPTHLRGTGESFAANIGGRMLGTFPALITTSLANYVSGATPARQLSYAAGIVGLSCYVLGLVFSIWLPEPPRDGVLSEA